MRQDGFNQSPAVLKYTATGQVSLLNEDRSNSNSITWEKIRKWQFSAIANRKAIIDIIPHLSALSKGSKMLPQPSDKK